jgi:hypothetical protein
MWDQAEQRLLSRVDMGASPAGCWMWQGARARGYGVISIGGKNKGAHRVSYEMLVGPVPDGLQLDHLCREHACINPLHLEPVTASENKQRDCNQNTRKTHCDSGHPFDAENTYHDSRGWRGCRACRCEGVRRYKDKGR